MLEAPVGPLLGQLPAPGGHVPGPARTPFARPSAPRNPHRSQISFGITTFFVTFVDNGYGPLIRGHFIWLAWLATLVLQELIELYEDGRDSQLRGLLLEYEP